MLRRLVWRSSALLSTILMFTSGKPSICDTSLKSKPENSTVKCTHKRQKKKIIAWKDIAEKNHPRQNVRFSFVPTQVKCPWQTKELRGETATTISWGWKENENVANHPILSNWRSKIQSHQKTSGLFLDKNNGEI